MTYKYNPPRGWAPSVSRDEITHEFSKWNQQAGSTVVSDWDLPMYHPGDRAAQVTFLLRGVRMVVRIDQWTDFNVNLRCCFLNIRDLRLAEARGALESLRETLMALPAPATKRSPHEILGIRDGEPLPVAEGAYRAKARALHPDLNPGDDAAMKELNAAIAELRERAAAIPQGPSR